MRSFLFLLLSLCGSELLSQGTPVATLERPTDSLMVISVPSDSIADGTYVPQWRPISELVTGGIDTIYQNLDTTFIVAGGDTSIVIDQSIDDVQYIRPTTNSFELGNFKIYVDTIKLLRDGELVKNNVLFRYDQIGRESYILGLRLKNGILAINKDNTSEQVFTFDGPTDTIIADQVLNLRAAFADTLATNELDSFYHVNQWYYGSDTLPEIAGPQGPIGATGPQGPAGPADWNAIPNIPADIADGDDDTNYWTLPAGNDDLSVINRTGSVLLNRTTQSSSGHMLEIDGKSTTDIIRLNGRINGAAISAGIQYRNADTGDYWRTGIIHAVYDHFQIGANGGSGMLVNSNNQFGFGGYPDADFSLFIHDDFAVQVGKRFYFGNNTTFTSLLSPTSTSFAVANNGLELSRFTRIGTSGATQQMNQYSTATLADSYPAYAFSGDGNTGMYRHGEDEVGLTTAGVGRLIASNDGVRIPLLDSDLTPPTTTGTTKMVITDNTGQLSFTDAPVNTDTSGTYHASIDGDLSATNELQTISKAGSTVTLSDGGGSFTDDDTQLTEAEVDSYVANNGYLTVEVDGSTTNELQTISKVGSTVTLSDGGGSFTDDNGYWSQSGTDISYQSVKVKRTDHFPQVHVTGNRSAGLSSTLLIERPGSGTYAMGLTLLDNEDEWFIGKPYWNGEGISFGRIDNTTGILNGTSASVANSVFTITNEAVEVKRLEPYFIATTTSGGSAASPAKAGMLFKSSNGQYVTGSIVGISRASNFGYGKIALSTTSSIGNAATMQERLTIDGPDGKVGIGSHIPLEKLHVGGKIRVDDVAASNAISLLGIDASDRITTTNVTALLGSSPWTVSGANINYTTGNVGIGTTSSAFALNIDGSMWINNGKIIDGFNNGGTTGQFLGVSGSENRYLYPTITPSYNTSTGMLSFTQGTSSSPPSASQVVITPVQHVGRGWALSESTTSTNTIVLDLNAVSFETGDVDVNASLNRFTANSSGYYRISYQGKATWATGLEGEIVLSKNGGGNLAEYTDRISFDSEDEEGLDFTDVIYLASGDYLQLRFRQVNSSGIPFTIDTLYITVEKI